ncbi:hypothetical protein ASPBRDRAFT_205280 [Aspergillus brasiliensis CBS 101740]|uniref:Uncharacterized protein n=1 Tax=Aspergillus brasiliensis (strain CBS 101740 / IMI 381727 / IBT 21946) TaxID=767769 RepID=A0A1L9UU69_ASPBC|nr:hypothetical protein ASPBRDRAFT_205280 [Aspergillus brasiliensis CBS 101740]
MKLTYLLLSIYSTTALATDPNAEAECGSLGVMKLDPADLPEGVTLADVRKHIRWAQPIPPKLLRRPALQRRPILNMIPREHQRMLQQTRILPHQRHGQQPATLYASHSDRPTPQCMQLEIPTRVQMAHQAGIIHGDPIPQRHQVRLREKDVRIPVRIQRAIFPSIRPYDPVKPAQIRRPGEQ